jgi:hypothetical protein
MVDQSPVLGVAVATCLVYFSLRGEYVRVSDFHGTTRERIYRRAHDWLNDLQSLFSIT